MSENMIARARKAMVANKIKNMTGIYSTDDRLSLIRAVNITNGVVDGFWEVV